MRFVIIDMTPGELKKYPANAVVKRVRFEDTRSKHVASHMWKTSGMPYRVVGNLFVKDVEQDRNVIELECVEHLYEILDIATHVSISKDSNWFLGDEPLGKITYDRVIEEPFLG